MQLEDGHTLFDYDVGLNDIIQLMVRTVILPPVTTPAFKSQSHGDVHANGGTCTNGGTSLNGDVNGDVCTNGAEEEEMDHDVSWTPFCKNYVVVGLEIRVVKPHNLNTHLHVLYTALYLVQSGV